MNGLVDRLDVFAADGHHLQLGHELTPAAVRFASGVAGCAPSLPRTWWGDLARADPSHPPARYASRGPGGTVRSTRGKPDSAGWRRGYPHRGVAVQRPHRAVPADPAAAWQENADLLVPAFFVSALMFSFTLLGDAVTDAVRGR